MGKVLLIALLLLFSGCHKGTKEETLPNGKIIWVESSNGYTYSTFCFRGKLYLERLSAVTYTGEPCGQETQKGGEA
jgi:hypothetical protein